jgi:hypothetical protein
VQFDGEDYGNPSLPPSHKIRRSMGRRLIADNAKFTPLND